MPLRPDMKFKYCAKGRPRPKAGAMNKTESEYLAYLQYRQSQGGLLFVSHHEGMKLKLADGTHYTADFVVMTNSLELEIHDVKGTTKVKKIEAGVEVGKTERPYLEGDARTKLKFVAETWPIVLKVVWRCRASGQWIEEVY